MSGAGGKGLTAGQKAVQANAGRVVGLQPWLPWPLSHSRWWTEPVAAERLAALRIGLAAVLLVDVLTSYLPRVYDFFGKDSLGDPPLFAYYRTFPKWWWSILGSVEDPQLLQAAMLVWLVAIGCLLLGWQTRLGAVLVWVLSTSFANINPYIDNAGDQVRGIVLFYLMLTPCGAAWSVDSWRRRRRGGPAGPVLVHPWGIRLLFLQMVFIYGMNGTYKLFSLDWQKGDSLYYVMADLILSRVSYTEVTVPYELTRWLTWSVLVWEAGFPLWVALPWTRKLALVFGVLFHVGIMVGMEIGSFVPYMLTLYLPLIPWERWRKPRPGESGWRRLWQAVGERPA